MREFNMEMVVQQRLIDYEAKQLAIRMMEQECAGLDSEIAAYGEKLRLTKKEKRDLTKAICHRSFLRQRIEAQSMVQKQLFDALEMLDPEEQKVLDVFYIHRQSYPETILAEQLHMDERTAWRRRKEAMEHLTVLLYGGSEL